MIESFQDADTKLLWETGKSRRVPASIRKAALKKLSILHWATSLSDLAVPGVNHLEALVGDRAGQYSIRINEQYRVCFIWIGRDTGNVEIVDHH